MAQQDIDALKAKVQAQTDAVASATALMAGLAQQIRDAADDPDELRAIADQIDANTKTLADAVVANTPAAPENPGEPTPAPA